MSRMARSLGLDDAGAGRLRREDLAHQLGPGPGADGDRRVGVVALYSAAGGRFEPWAGRHAMRYGVALGLAWWWR